MKRFLRVTVAIILMVTMIPVSVFAATDDDAYAEAIADAVVGARSQEELGDFMNLLDEISNVDVFIKTFANTFAEFSTSGDAISDTAILFSEVLDFYDGSNMDRAKLISEIKKFAGSQSLEAAIGMDMATTLAGIKTIDDLFVMIDNTSVDRLLREDKQIFITDSSHEALSVDKTRATSVLQLVLETRQKSTENVDEAVNKIDSLVSYYAGLSSSEKVVVYNYLDNYNFIEVSGDDGGAVVVPPTTTTPPPATTTPPPATTPSTPAETPAEEKPVESVLIDDEQVVLTTPNFTDLVDVPWAQKGISTLYRYGVIKGKSETEFDPNGDITRAEFAALIVRMLDLVEAGETDFSDIKDSDWYASVVKIAAQSGYVKGVGNGRFAPKENVTREQVATIIGRILVDNGDEPLNDFMKADVLSKISDADQISTWAVDGLALCQSRLVLISTEGDADSNVYPGRVATRAEVAEMLYRLASRIDTKVVVDNE